MEIPILNDILSMLQSILNFVVDAYASIPNTIDTLENCVSSASESLAVMPTEIVAPAISMLYLMINLAALRWIT